jgi:hypothetical protein
MRRTAAGWRCSRSGPWRHPAVPIDAYLEQLAVERAAADDELAEPERVDLPQLWWPGLQQERAAGSSVDVLVVEEDYDPVRHRASKQVERNNPRQSKHRLDGGEEYTQTVPVGSGRVNRVPGVRTLSSDPHQIRRSEAMVEVGGLEPPSRPLKGHPS